MTEKATQAAPSQPTPEPKKNDKPTTDLDAAGRRFAKLEAQQGQGKTSIDIQ